MRELYHSRGTAGDSGVKAECRHRIGKRGVIFSPILRTVDMSGFEFPGSQAQRAIQEGLLWPIDGVPRANLIHEKAGSGEKLAQGRHEKDDFSRFWRGC